MSGSRGRFFTMTAADHGAPPGAPIHRDRKLYLDGWRGISILLVLVGHFLRPPVLQWGTLGVEMFFVLSGRLMAEILFVERFPIGPFILRRFSRVWPGLCSFAVISMLLVDLAGWPQRGPFPPVLLLTTLTFTYQYVAHLGGPSLYQLAHLWSLCIEEHCYLMLVALICLLGRGRRTLFTLVGISLVSLADGAWRATVLHQSFQTAYFLTENHIHSILIPLILFMMLRNKVKSITGAGYLSLVFGALGVLLAYHRVPIWVTYSLAPVLLGMSVVLLPALPLRLRRLLEMRWLVWLGRLSYSIYLWQQPFMVASTVYGLLINIASLVGAIAAGVASFFLVEDPCRRWLNAHVARVRLRGRVVR